MPINDDLRPRIPELIRQMRRRIIWKPGAAARHLLKRKLRGHLPTNSSLADYENMIHSLLETDNAEIYVYYADDTPYLSVSALIDERLWLMIASFEGVMETAFVVENPETYINRPVFQYIGRMVEVM